MNEKQQEQHALELEAEIVGVLMAISVIAKRLANRVVLLGREDSDKEGSEAENGSAPDAN